MYMMWYEFTVQVIYWLTDGLTDWLFVLLLVILSIYIFANLIVFECDCLLLEVYIVFAWIYLLYEIWYESISYDMMRYDMIWYDVLRYNVMCDTVESCIVWYGMILCDVRRDVMWGEMWYENWLTGKENRAVISILMTSWTLRRCYEGYMRIIWIVANTWLWMQEQIMILCLCMLLVIKSSQQLERDCLIISLIWTYFY